MEFFAATVAGVPLVSGLEWRTLTGLQPPAQEIGETARDIGASRYVETRNATDVTCGFLPDERRAELPKKAHSLAAMFAGVPGISVDSVLVIQENDVAVLAALRDGMPAPGFDGYGSAKEIIEMAQKFIQLSPNGVTVYGNCEALNPVTMSLEEMVAKSTALKSSRIRGVPRPWRRYAFTFMATFVVIGGAKYIYDYQAAQKRLAAERLAYVDVEAEYARNVKELFKTATPVKPSVQLVREMLASTPTAVGGWSLTEIVCQKDGCSYVWKNDFGTNRTFVPPEGVLNLKYSNKGDAILYQKAFPKALPKALDISKAPTLEQVLRDVTGDLQEYQDLAVSQAFEPPVVDFGVAPELPRPPARPYKEGAYALSGPWYALDVVQKLPDTATLETFRINIEGAQKINFNIVGKYYVK